MSVAGEADATVGVDAALTVWIAGAAAHQARTLTGMGCRAILSGGTIVRRATVTSDMTGAVTYLPRAGAGIVVSTLPTSVAVGGAAALSTGRWDAATQPWTIISSISCRRVTIIVEAVADLRSARVDVPVAVVTIFNSRVSVTVGIDQA